MFKKSFLILTGIIWGVVLYTLMSYTANVLLQDHDQLRFLLNGAYFFLIHSIFSNYRNEHKLISYSFYIPPILISIQLLFYNQIYTSNPVVFDLDLMLGLSITGVLLLTNHFNYFWRLIFFLILSAIVIFGVYPALIKNQYLKESSTLLRSNFKTQDKILIKKDRSRFKVNDVIDNNCIVVLSFINCKPCRELKTRLREMAKTNTRLEKRLIFITNGNLNSFEEFQKYESDDRIANYYDTGGTLSKLFVPESMFPVMLIFKPNGNISKYSGYTPGNINYIKELVTNDQ